MSITYTVFAEWDKFNMSMGILARNPDEALYQMSRYLLSIYNINLNDIKMRIL